MPTDASTTPAWIAVIGDRVEGFEPHDTIESSIDDAAKALRVAAPRVRWLSTDVLEADGAGVLEGAAAVWCAPGGPYRSLDGAVEGIRFARERNVPFIGTCAGFQHAVIEFARNVLGHDTASHAEYGEGGELFIDELLCSLAGQTMEVEIVDDDLAQLYGTANPREKYYCRFGVSPRWRAPLHDAGLRIAAIDARDQDVRVMRLAGHPFYVLTLFVPQTSSTPTRPHPLVTGLLSAAVMAAGAA
jgi:CTP synthase (UTP-ammonia lyase)